MAKNIEFIATRDMTWDMVAYRCYGDGKEFLFPVIMEANSQYKDYLSFEGGEVLQVPRTNEIPYLDVDTPYGQTVQVSVISSPWD